MVTGNRGSDVVDPLQGYSGLALFPRTFQVLPEASKPYDFDHELQAIHNHLKPMALRNPNTLREQAKIIVDGSSKALNSRTASYQASVDENEVVPAMAEINPQERRPALGRKRARFSLKPNLSQPVTSLEPMLDFKSLKDPEEFFMAYERHENAKREIQKQMGGTVLDLDEQNPSRTERPRRPGILGRSVKYKHLYSSEVSETNKNVLSSRETFDSSIHSPASCSSQQEAGHDFTSQGTELAGSLSKEEHKFDKILDELLSYNCEDLEGDRAQSLLQERLQIKPIELEKLCLPDFQDIPKIDLKSSRSGKLPKRSHVLSNIDNLLNGLRSTTPMKHKQGAESYGHHLTSPTLSKSPLASLSVLNQRIFRSSPSNDPFSAHDIDRFPAPSPHIVKDDNIEVVNTGSPEVAVRDFACTYEKHVSDVTSKVDEVIDLGSSASLVPVADDIIDSNMDNRIVNETGVIHLGSSASRIPVDDDIIDSNKDNRVTTVNGGSSASHVPVDNEVLGSNMDKRVINEKLCGRDADGDAQANEANIEDKIQVEDTQQEKMVPTQSVLIPEESNLDNSNSTQSDLDQRSTTSIQDQARDGHSRIPDNGSKEHTEIVQEHSRIPLDKKRKEQSPAQKARKRRKIPGDRRKSLAGAGTMWESGVRRSTRIRCRPLEYWKGERLLYGRIHNSLPTVIGLKYASPGKEDGKPTLKVKSYVSDEHKDLLELASLH